VKLPQIRGLNSKAGEAEVAKETIRLRAGEREVQATRERDASGAISVTIDGGEPFLVGAIGSGACRVTQGNRTWRAITVAQGNRRWVFVDGQAAVVEVQETASRRGNKGNSGPQSLTAPMPATVTKIMASANQRVKKGETLLLLEAMKMELPVRAPADGIVKAVHCKEGELVQPDSLLIDFE
jgi:3-methylcrotonyl-CoA carboxylase alpha subunit